MKICLKQIQQDKTVLLDKEMLHGNSFRKIFSSNMIVLFFSYFFEIFEIVKMFKQIQHFIQHTIFRCWMVMLNSFAPDFMMKRCGIRTNTRIFLIRNRVIRNSSRLSSETQETTVVSSLYSTKLRNFAS